FMRATIKRQGALMRNLSFPIGHAMSCVSQKHRATDRAAANFTFFKRWSNCFQLALLLILSMGTALAQSIPPDIPKKLDDLDKAAKSAQMAGDNSWMLTSSALVLMMTGPGLALFYGGLVRRKNVLGTMMHSFILMAVISILWAVIGYSQAFAEGSPFMG